MFGIGRDENDDRREEYGGNRSHGGNFPAGGYGQDDDLRGAAEHASRHAGDSGDSSFFSNVIGSLSQKKEHLAQQDVDEDDAVQQHQRFFGGGSGSDQADSSSMGTAAAMQALKMFNGGGSGSSQSDFIGLAMAQASKLFDEQSSQGNVSGGASKESSVMQAGEMALKMYMKTQGGGSSSGLLSLASKFF
ncbi:hypothetical protein BX600DRAFT_36680 [Xylariales sp. PMI_506]|nr:hypothetical protein BX600DRAFT_36680 [Xylariales sp. PMI_506]